MSVAVNVETLSLQMNGFQIVMDSSSLNFSVAECKEYLEDMATEFTGTETVEEAEARLEALNNDGTWYIRHN